MSEKRVKPSRPDHEEFKRSVESAARLNGVTNQFLAGAVSVTPSALSAFLNGQTHSIHLATRICAVLNIDMNEAFIRCGIPSREEGEGNG